MRVRRRCAIGLSMSLLALVAAACGGEDGGDGGGGGQPQDTAETSGQDAGQETSGHLDAAADAGSGHEQDAAGLDGPTPDVGGAGDVPSAADATTGGDVGVPAVWKPGPCHGKAAAGWTAPARLTQNAEPVTKKTYAGVQVAITDEGVTHVIYLCGVGDEVNGGVFHQMEVPGGWSAPVKIGEHSANVRDLLLAPDGKTLHALYHDLPALNPKLQHRVFDGKSWSKDVMLPMKADGKEWNSSSTRLCYLPTGAVLLMSTGGGVEPLWSSTWTAGQGWTPVGAESLKLSAPAANKHEHLAMACAKDGTVHVALQGADKTWYLVRQIDGSWSAPQEVHGSSKSSEKLGLAVALDESAGVEARVLMGLFDQQSFRGWAKGAGKDLSVKGALQQKAFMRGTPLGTVHAVYWSQSKLAPVPLQMLSWNGAFDGPNVLVADASTHKLEVAVAASPGGKRAAVVWLQKDDPTQFSKTNANLCHVETE